MPIHRHDYKSNAVGALSDVRVIDMSRLVAGNVLTMVLADLGAEVWKVESLRGDALRSWQHAGLSTYWKQLARNKKSLGLDLRNPAAIDVLKRMIAGAAILVENYRPGTLEKMGLSPAILHSLNPKLVIVRISGWSQRGPYRNRPGFGTLIEGMCGLAAANGFPDREPVLPPGPIGDTMAGYAGASTALAAFHHANLTGRGQIVDQSLFMPLFISQGPQATNYRLNGAVRARDSNAVQYSVPRGIFKTRDGHYVSLSASMDPMPQRVFEAIGRGDLNANPNYSTTKGRFENKVEILEMVSKFISRMTQAEAVAYFESVDVTIAPIYDISQIVEDPHFQESDMVVEIGDDEMGYAPVCGFSNQLSDTPANFYRPAPRIGEHNEEILRDSGLTESEIRALTTSGAAHSGPPADRP